MNKVLVILTVASLAVLPSCKKKGCTDPSACNYAPNATDLGDCEYPEEGYNCDGSVNTFYTVDQLFGFGVSFNEIVNAGYTPNQIKITQTQNMQLESKKLEHKMVKIFS